MKITKDIIEDFFESKDINVDSNYVYVNEQPKASSYLLLGALAAITMKYYIAVFNDESLILATLTINSKFTGEIISIPVDSIEKYKVKNGIVLHKILIETEMMEFRLNVSKIMLAYDWHRENLNNIDLNGIWDYYIA